MKKPIRTLAACAAMLSAVAAAPATAGVVSNAAFVNGITLSGGAQDLSSGTPVERRLGFFSDLYYDPLRGEWWGLSDRGPGGGLLNYETRVQRFTLDIAGNGAVSNFQVQQTVLFRDGGQPMNGIAPNPTSVLGRAFDPEGLVVHPGSGHLVVSDEYGPTVAVFDRGGNLLRRFDTPTNLVPRNAGTGTPNFSDDTGNTAGKRGNRGFEGLAISPDGKYVYAMLQSAMLDEGGSNGVYARIVKYDFATGHAVAQYAYRLDTDAQGRGISALVALGNDKFLVLERNNRGIGVGATLANADKMVYEIDLASAVDVTNIVLPASGSFAGAVSKSPKIIDLDANTLSALGGFSPEKWEGLTVGPQLAGGDYLLLAGTDNDYSVTQTGSGEQFDVWFRFGDANPFNSSIRCPIGQVSGCTFANGSGATLTSSHELLPGVLHAYTARLSGFVQPVGEPGAGALAALALLLMARGRRQRRR